MESSYSSSPAPPHCCHPGISQSLLPIFGSLWHLAYNIPFNHHSCHNPRIAMSEFLDALNCNDLILQSISAIQFIGLYSGSYQHPELSSPGLSYPHSDYFLFNLKENSTFLTFTFSPNLSVHLNFILSTSRVQSRPNLQTTLS